jgi:uncharacterized protein (DUF433 family)
MATTETRYEHIVLDGDIPMLNGTTMKVVELVTAHQAHGWSPEELSFQFPYLTLGQIHSALAYYWDHKQALDDDIARRMELVDQLQLRSRPSPVAERLRAHLSR